MLQAEEEVGSSLAERTAKMLSGGQWPGGQGLALEGQGSPGQHLFPFPARSGARGAATLFNWGGFTHSLPPSLPPHPPPLLPLLNTAREPQWKGTAPGHPMGLMC